MTAIYCSPSGKAPTPTDVAIVEQMRAALARRAPLTGPMDPYFDADVHLVAPDVTDRTDFVIVDRKVELP